ncbi:aspartate 1-decarboxylase [Flavobacteriaceae bacterium]|jgi:aspartate 1-decarboxylase|nr:aspartate 1-decarboxylase [Flavobacteriaceae bacterium]MDA7808436.1 aspartate 1-decarboxylase [Flavobacteriaceae bacterium]MDA9037553.1 aspartate 1-decarboxylase [Flavobacteriaceae bacterium]MDC0872211.1 aspartate 1-decarboxylase [Flavobacteriaceae bacterium]
MTIEVLKSKIHRVTVTHSELNYIGSITIDKKLIKAANLIVGEKVQIVNINNGERLETYVIEGEEGSGEVTLNGPAARKAQKGDLIIIISYAHMKVEKAKSFKPTLIFPDEITNQLS